MIENTNPKATPVISFEEQARIISQYKHKSKRLPLIMIGCVATIILGWGLDYLYPLPNLTPGDVFLIGVAMIILLFSLSVYLYYRCPKCRAPLPTKGKSSSSGPDTDDAENCPKCGVRLK